MQYIPVDLVEPLVTSVISFNLASAPSYIRSRRLYSLRSAAARPTISRVIVSKEIMAANTQHDRDVYAKGTGVDMKI